MWKIFTWWFVLQFDPLHFPALNSWQFWVVFVHLYQACQTLLISFRKSLSELIPDFGPQLLAVG